MNGKVYIIGVGPGDPELMTIKARRIIQEEVDVVVYDRLIPEEILALIPKSVERIYAGKSMHRHCMTQEDIQEVLIEKAKLGLRVGRVKGGDPFIFGRGGEEMLALQEAGIPYEVIPGVTAASACAAEIDVPLTYRNLALGVHFLTGHQQAEPKVEHDWKRYADPNVTLVIYMGLANIDHICLQLTQHGLPGTTPAVAIQRGSCDNKRIAFTSVEALVGTLQDQAFEAPTLIIIGNVVSLSPRRFICDSDSGSS